MKNLYTFAKFSQFIYKLIVAINFIQFFTLKSFCLRTFDYNLHPLKIYIHHRKIFFKFLFLTISLLLKSMLEWAGTRNRLIRRESVDGVQWKRGKIVGGGEDCSDGGRGRIMGAHDRQRGRSALSVRMGCQRVSINLNRGMKSRRGMSIKVRRREVVSLSVDDVKVLGRYAAVLTWKPRWKIPASAER